MNKMRKKLETECSSSLNIFSCNQCNKIDTCPDYLNLKKSVRNLSPSEYTDAVQNFYEITGDFA